MRNKKREKCEQKRRDYLPVFENRMQTSEMPLNCEMFYSVQNVKLEMCDRGLNLFPEFDHLIVE